MSSFRTLYIFSDMNWPLNITTGKHQFMSVNKLPLELSTFFFSFSYIWIGLAWCFIFFIVCVASHSLFPFP